MEVDLSSLLRPEEETRSKEGGEEETKFKVGNPGDRMVLYKKVLRVAVL